MRAPVIVAVNGAAVGAGFSLAMAGDFVLASDNAKFAMAYTSAGSKPGWWRQLFFAAHHRFTSCTGIDD
jgi:enoyl-CoA hydratase/carnithine racemase